MIKPRKSISSSLNCVQAVNVCVPSAAPRDHGAKQLFHERKNLEELF